MTPTKSELDSVVDCVIVLVSEYVQNHAKNTDNTISKWFWAEESHRKVLRAYVQTELAWGNR